MISSLRNRQRGLAPLLSALLVAVSVLVPVLDRGDAGRQLVLESEHDPAACVAGHDHTLCTQVEATQALPDERPHRSGPPPHDAVAPAADLPAPAAPRVSGPGLPRAPPRG